MQLNDLFMIAEDGQQKSRLTRLNINIAGRFFASKNKIQLAILESGGLGYRIGSFSSTDVGQLKVMCQISLKLPAMFDQNLPHNFDKILEKHITTKNALKA